MSLHNIPHPNVSSLHNVQQPNISSLRNTQRPNELSLHYLREAMQLGAERMLDKSRYGYNNDHDNFDEPSEIQE